MENQEELQQDIQEESTNNEVEETVYEDLSNLNNTDAVNLLVQKAKKLVNQVNGQYGNIKQTLQNDINEYEDAKSNLKDIVLSINTELINHLSYQQEQLDELEAQEDGIQYAQEQEELDDIQQSVEILKEDDFQDTPAYEITDNISSMYIQEPSSGGFGAFVMGLIGGGATLASMAYFASTQLGIKLDPSKLPSMETCKPIFEYYTKLVQQSEPTIGMGLMGVSALLVFTIIYKIKKGSRTTKNLEFAKSQLLEAEDFVVQTEYIKSKFEEVDNHLKSAIDIFKLYGVILNEQNGKLARIMFVESDKITDGDFHDKSIKEIQDTQELISEVKKYMATPLSDEDGYLSQEIKQSLSNLKAKVDDVLKRFY